MKYKANERQKKKSKSLLNIPLAYDNFSNKTILIFYIKNSAEYGYL